MEELIKENEKLKELLRKAYNYVSKNMDVNELPREVEEYCEKELGCSDIRLH